VKRYIYIQIPNKCGNYFFLILYLFQQASDKSYSVTGRLPFVYSPI